MVVSGEGAGATLLTGGTALPPWTETNDAATGLPLWSAPLAASSAELHTQLFLQDKEGGGFGRRLTARSGVMSYDHASLLDPKHSIVFRPGQVQDSYYSQKDVLVTLFHCWTATTHHIASITPSNRTLSLVSPPVPHVDIPHCEHASGKRFVVENARELLRQPGQFYHDRRAGQLLYLPLAAEREHAASLTAYVPRVITLVRVDGAVGAELANLTLAHTAVDWAGFFSGDGDGQAATNLRTAAVEVLHTTSFALTNVEVAHTGGFGLLVNSSSSGVRVTGCDLHDLGAGGVRVGATADSAPVSDVNITDSQVHDGGYVYIMGPGISVQQCSGCRIEHNNIYDFFYTGISSGAHFLSGAVRDTRIAKNAIWSIGRGIMSDMACFYSYGGKQPGVVVDNNLCHGVRAYFDPDGVAGGGYGGWGLYATFENSSLPFSKNGAKSGFEVCFDPSTFWYWGQQSSRIQNKEVYATLYVQVHRPKL